MTNLTEMAFELKDRMQSVPATTRYGPAYSPRMVTAIAEATAAIARLDARYCASPVAKAWARRAMWSGYTKALQLQQAEIDEIDVFSWGCGLKVPGRALRTTHLDVYEVSAAKVSVTAEPNPRRALP